jgi:hypothetical protein
VLTDVSSPTFESWSWRTRAAVIINQSSLHNLHNRMKHSGFIFQKPKWSNTTNIGVFMF